VVSCIWSRHLVSDAIGIDSDTFDPCDLFGQTRINLSSVSLEKRQLHSWREREREREKERKKERNDHGPAVHYTCPSPLCVRR